MRARLAYFGSRLGENMAETPEGFLICRNVPIARTGYQTYLPEEIGRAGDAPVSVYRDAREVFSPGTLASFEGKPVTCGHPPEDVSPRNAASFICGHVQNVRRGAGEESDCILADLFLTDPALIERVRGGLREVSCGYRCRYADGPRGVEQRAIRGNHVAVVEAGRAGSRVAIRDARTAPHERSNTMKLRKTTPICDECTAEPVLEQLLEVLQRIALLLEARAQTLELPEPSELLSEDDPAVAEIDPAQPLRQALTAIKPLIAALPENQRALAADRATRALRRAAGAADASPSVYAALSHPTLAPREDYSALGRRIMKERNPHYWE